MELLVIASPAIGLVVLLVALKLPHLRSAAPVMFSLLVASVVLAYVGASRGLTFSAFAAGSGAIISACGLALFVNGVGASPQGGHLPLCSSLWPRPMRWRAFERQFRQYVEQKDAV